MKKTFSAALTLLGTAGLLAATSASAQTVSTKGGLSIASEDGNFAFQLGGRIHFDGYLFSEPEIDGVEVPRASGQSSGTEFRRARLSLSGQAYGWAFKFEEEFAGSDVDERELWIGRSIGPGFLTLGQFKPYRGMDELTSSNELLMMERPSTSASGVYNGRQFQQGVGYLVGRKDGRYTLGASAYTLRNDDSTRNEGVGFAARGTYASPLVDNRGTLHFGGSYSVDNTSQNPANVGVTTRVGFAGRRSNVSSDPLQSGTIGSVAPGESASTLGLELAASIGAFFLQAEHAWQRLGQGAGGSDQDVAAKYVMIAYNFSHLRKAYKADKGVFAALKPSDGGALELTARYDNIENSDSPEAPEATSITVGANYYVNPQLRFMVNLTHGEFDVGAPGARTSAELDQLAVRAQLHF
ncbi:OprO/OprP family phosphate-selective porin [Flagellatimonas centrodinii]|uniref:OprO/OprP family phosphate-selective porin n=1 Tax=Flagellatimonas centrodinii TaxID=2806210 RepID=UPI001FED3CDB|nr:porin [Flagellatimonas centrodinii]ULQ45781.1 OprO/OprP family phosphate-selective porin [Flagellatimonas centrodinii]